MRRRGFILAAPLAACAEMKRPPSPSFGLGDGASDPVRGAITAMAPAFADRAHGLANHPIETAEAAARLEYVTAAISRDSRYAVLSESLRRELLLARTELRDALGIAVDLSPDDAVAGLMAAARALRANDSAAAAAALPSPGFRPGGVESVERLGDVGPLPQASIASALASEEVTRLDAENGWTGVTPIEGTGTGTTTFGLGGSTSRGY